jgi:antitoxin VapB
MGDQVARVRLIRTEAGHRIDLPAGFVLGADEAILRRDGARLILEPVARPSLLSVLDGLADLDEEWPGIADPPPEPVRI